MAGEGEKTHPGFIDEVGVPRGQEPSGERGILELWSANTGETTGDATGEATGALDPSAARGDRRIAAMARIASRLHAPPGEAPGWGPSAAVRALWSREGLDPLPSPHPLVVPTLGPRVDEDEVTVQGGEVVDPATMPAASPPPPEVQVDPKGLLVGLLIALPLVAALAWLIYAD